MPNPTGVNGWGGFETQPPHGAIKRMNDLMRAAPLAGAPMAGSALNTPRRSGKRAQRGQPQQQTATPPQQTPAQPEMPYPVWLAEQWKALANDPEASDLVRGYAARAVQGLNG